MLAKLFRVGFGLVLPLTVVSCHSAGPYGFSTTYTPLDAEEEAAENAKEYDPVMAARFPAEWRKHSVSVFGVVKSRSEGHGGKAYLTLSVRTLSLRNLCDEGGEETCRVTVSEREHATLHSEVPLRSEDNLGEHSVTTGSLVRVIGKLSDRVDPSDGEPVLVADYYRHWPAHFYVTTADRVHMTR